MAKAIRRGDNGWYKCFSDRIESGGLVLNLLSGRAGLAGNPEVQKQLVLFYSIID